jgi:hypothetical protein
LDLSYASLSLIEFIYVDDFADFQFTGKQDRFDYLAKNWFGFVQIIAKLRMQDADQVLGYLEEYFVWEDQQEEE